MSEISPTSSPFLTRVIAVIEDHLSDEQFGVSELADRLSMSRSNLLRRIKQETNESVSVLIRNVRLDRAQILLKEGEKTSAEVSFAVGFGSTSYFTKCFRERFGYTPGETQQMLVNDEAAAEQEAEPKVISAPAPVMTQRDFKVGLLVASAVVLVLVALFIWTPSSEPELDLPKTIAVLPFKNDSDDASNVYFMNGLLEAILDDFQKIEDIHVTSRTTVEQYRATSITIPELSEELNVSYFVEGSGQKVGEEILLTIQLIEGGTDKQLWSKRYQRELKDVFALQADVAKSIAREINAVITPVESERIDQVPTENLVAYDYYLAGLVLLRDKSGNGLAESIVQFKKAIKEDGSFAHAYAYIAIANYFLDQFQVEKVHTEDVKAYSEKAAQLNPELGESLIAQALYFMQINAFQEAIVAFEEVLDYYPNTAWIHNFLSNIYAFIVPDTEKYLMHALEGIGAAASTADSSEASYMYLHLSNALVQTGFIEEAAICAERSLAYDPSNHFSVYLRSYIKLARDMNLERTRDELLMLLAEDSTKIDVIQEVAKVNYNLGAYAEAWTYYEKMEQIKRAFNLELYQDQDVNIGFVLDQLGRPEEAQTYYDRYLNFTNENFSAYKGFHLATYYAATGDKSKAMTSLRQYAETGEYQYWVVRFLETDPILIGLADDPSFQPMIDQIEQKFWKDHETLRKRLSKEGALNRALGMEKRVSI